MPTLFVSDLHLHDSRPEATDCFVDFLRTQASDAEALYILGDLFEAWIGDDDPEPHHRVVVAALRDYTARGASCFFLHGNRDFLIRERFAQESGVTLLPEEVVVKLYDEPVLIMHGDQLCTDDTDYQRMRRILRNRAYQSMYLALPLGMRRLIGQRLRETSMTSTDTKTEAITDVVQASVESSLAAHGVQKLIHGHTHRPGIHRFSINGGDASRFVLGDWYTQGSVLVWDAQGQRLEARPFVSASGY